jgi:ABC-type uncharacterized transport system auxiliary subunit
VIVRWPQSTLARTFALTVTLLLAGCLQLMPDPPPPPQRYDFGPLREDSPAPLPHPVRLAAMDAPSWLAGSAILYRRLDDQPQALRAYARSEWIAAVPELFAQRTRHRLAQAGPADGREFVVRLELLSFEQVFTAEDQAHVELRARARLEGDGRARQQTELSLRRPSTPNAQGATRDLSALVDQAIDDLLQWLHEAQRDTP